jgi:cytidylate kinase
MGVNIAIDGTAGSGKGTLANELSKILGYHHLDTGAMFRTVAYKCLKEGVDMTDEKAVSKVVKNIDYKVKLEKDGDKHIQKNILDGEDLKDKIRTEKMSWGSSVVSQYGDVRNFTRKLQVEIAKKHDVIIEGRDIGTVILPNADFKFYLTATPEVRAMRRLIQYSIPQSEYNKVLKDVLERDKRDMERELCPLKIAEDAHYIDNTKISIEGTCDIVLKIIRSKLKSKNSLRN